MIKHLIIGFCAVIVSLGSMVISAHLFAAGGEPQPSAENRATEDIKSGVISVPVIKSGTIRGYVIAEFLCVIDTERAAKRPVVAYLADEVFRRIFNNEAADFARVELIDVPKLVAAMRESLNQRLGGEVVTDVLVQQFEYISKQEIRDQIRKNSG